MATTIIISTNVKPDLREVLIFILCFVFLFWRRERSNRLVTHYFVFRPQIACRKPQAFLSMADANPVSGKLRQQGHVYIDDVQQVSQAP